MGDKSLLGLVNSALGDEVDAKDEYEIMADLTLEDGSLSDIEKSLITAMIFKIQTDEKTHKVMLSVIKEVLENM